MCNNVLLGYFHGPQFYKFHAVNVRNVLLNLFLCTHYMHYVYFVDFVVVCRRCLTVIGKLSTAL